MSKGQQDPSSATDLTRPEDGYHEHKSSTDSLTHPSFISRLFIQHLNKLMDRGSSSPYTFKGLFPLGPEYEEAQSRRFSESVLASAERRGTSVFKWPFFWSVCAPVKAEFFKGLVLTFFSNCTSIAFPIFLRLFLEWIQDPTKSGDQGFLWAGLLSASTLLRSLFTSSGSSYIFASSALMSHQLWFAIGDRVSKLNDSSQKGKIISMFTTEMRTVARLVTTGSDLILNPLFIIIYTGMIVYVIGWFGIIAPALVFLFLPLQNKLESFYLKNLRTRMSLSEQRSKVLAESIEGIKSIKFSAWELLVSKKIDGIRCKERGLILAGQVMDSFSEACIRVIPLVGTIIVLWAYPAVYGNKTLSLPDTYFLIGVITMFGRPVSLLLWSFVSFISAIAALERMEQLLKSPEPEVVRPSTELPAGSIELEMASFTWGKHKKDPDGDKTSPSKQQIEDAEPNVASGNTPTVLKEVSLKVLPGELIAIVGPVASGKSTLLLSLLSAVQRVSGSLRFNGSTAFVPQEPFLLNDTVKNNITFGLPFDQSRFENAIERSQLRPDLAELPGQEDTEIGERGINLSGGQKQRVSIARALYAQADILIADDCLSALDAYVGKQVFERVLCGSFANKTRIFVTHQLHYVEDPRVDRVVYLKEGMVVGEGKFVDLLENNAEFREFISAGRSITKENPCEERSPSFVEPELDIEENPVVNLVDASDSLSPTEQVAQASPLMGHDDPETERTGLKKAIKDSEAKQAQEADQKAKGKLTKDELKFTGQVPGRIYWTYMKAGGVGLVISCISLYLLNSFLVQVANYWAGKWAQKGTYLGVTIDADYGSVYVVIAVLVLFTFTFRSLLYGLFGANSGYQIYHKVVLNVLRRPMRFFDTTPNGVVMNRCSDDVAQVDFTLSLVMGVFLDSTSQMVVGLAIVMVILPYLIVVCIIIVALVWWSFHRYLLTVVELRRLTTLAMSPVINRVSECLTGAVSLRAYNQTKWVQSKFEQSIEILSNTLLHDRLAGSWMNFRLELAIGLLGTSVSLLVAAARYSNFSIGIESDSAGTLNVLFATVLTNTFSIGGNLSYLIFAFGEVCKGMGSVQRLVEYSEHTELEPEWDLPAPPLNWPTEGAVSFRRLSARYRAGLPQVLQDFSCDILPRQKVGIVGRTGSGKSSLLLCLLRMLYEDSLHEDTGEAEKDNQNGPNRKTDPLEVTDSESGIFIDGVRIDRVGLHHLRRAVAVIPQDPMLLHGTVASNVDPLASADPDAVLRSLQQVQFFDTVKGEDVVAQRLRRLAATLGRDPTDAEATAEKERPVTDGDKMALEVEGKGANLSLGQRQLICISRCLIRKPKILLMDEATANVDQKTDAIIQRVVKRDLPDATVITIAHRLLTIAQYDKVVVLAKGEKVEEGRPGELLEKKGEFEKLVAEGGAEFMEKMRRLSKEQELDLEALYS